MNTTRFKTGAVRDTQEGKLDFVEAISFTAHERFARYMTGKKKKYGIGNFKKGIPIESYEQSLMRHVDKYFRNKYENGNDEPGEDHLAAIRFNVDGIMHEEEQAKIIESLEKEKGESAEPTQICGVIVGDSPNYRDSTRTVVRCANVPPCPLHGPQPPKASPTHEELFSHRNKLCEHFQTPQSEDWEVMAEKYVLEEVANEKFNRTWMMMHLRKLIPRILSRKDAEVMACIPEGKTADIEMSETQQHEIAGFNACRAQMLTNLASRK